MGNRLQMLLVTTAYYLNMKSNRTPNDPASNRKGGQPYWDKMKPSKPVPALRKQKTTTGSECAPIELKNEKGWDVVANWYDKMVGDAGSDYHKNVIMPALLDRLEPLKGARVCDVCCGQGFVGKLLVQQGAAYVHGVDASPQLIGSAKKRAGADARLSFEVVNASNPGSWADGSYDLVTCLLAVHDVAEIDGLFANIASALKATGRAYIVFMHPCFRMPKHSHWGWDAENKIQYRRMDRYGSALTIPITTHPGRANSEVTMFYHRPLPAYITALTKAGLAVTGMDELCSHRRSQIGPRSKAEHLAAEEFPLFMMMEVKRFVAPR